MAISLAPDTYLPDIELVAAAGTVTAQSVAIPLTTLEGLSAAEANPTTGDIREVTRTILDSLYNAILTTPEADRPTRMTIEKTINRNIDDINKQFHTYIVRFQTQVPSDSISMQAE
jgi:hypothetical protein